MARLILSLDGAILAEYNMAKERYTIGRLPDNDVRIDNPTVSGHHSVIINILNDSFLEDLNSTNGTYVNGRLIKKHALQNGDVITVGRHQLRYIDSAADETTDQEFARTMVIDRNQAGGAAAIGKAAAAVAQQRPAPEGAAQPISVAKIQVLTGTFQGRELPLEKALTTLGRPGAQVIAISRRGDCYHLVQVENSSGREAPRLNGEPIGQQARKLNDNDVIELIGVKMGFFLN